MKKILLILTSCFVFSSCEKDDVCDSATPTTPKVVIEFFDIASPTTAKNITNLKVTATGFTSELPFNGVSKITVPLKTFQDISTLNFILNGNIDPITDDNLDEINFNYSRKETYVSKACGYKTTFVLNSTNPVSVKTDSNNWIQNIIVTQPNIENENETHVKIYF